MNNKSGRKNVVYPELTNVNGVNQFFARISCEQNNSYNYVNAKVVNFNTSRPVCDGFSPMLVDYLLKTIKATSPGYDAIPFWVFTKCSFELSDVVCHLLNTFLLSGFVPEQWKKAIVTPIPKVPKPSGVSDFRPISVTPILSRLMEKYIVKQYMWPALLRTDGIRDQFAFRPTGSTTCALTFVLHNVTKMLETNAYVRCLQIDYSRAFDVISHEILIAKLKLLDIPLCVLHWVISFLQNRSQSVRYNGKISKDCQINRGIVQGSGLGPVLYTVMANDMKTVSCINLLCKYADDTDLLVPEKSDVSLADEFMNIKKWASDNKMIINCAKTKEIVFTKPNPRNFIQPLKIPDIEIVENAKYLGVTLSNHLKFDEHVKLILTQCSQRLYLMRKLKNQGLAQNKLDIIFSSLVVSKLKYAMPAWGGFLSASLCSQINSFLKRAHKFGLYSKLIDISTTLDEVDKHLFKQAENPTHCLFHLLPPKCVSKYELRERGHPYPLSAIPTELHKKSFINRCLFKLK